jgi:hypothetical protein
MKGDTKNTIRLKITVRAMAIPKPDKGLLLRTMNRRAVKEANTMPHNRAIVTDEASARLPATEAIVR